MERKAVRSEAMESISERLSSMEGLYFPRALHSNTVNPSQRKAILLDLLSRDVTVFLGTPIYLSPTLRAFYLTLKVFN